MIYEIRTYNLKTGTLSEYWKRFSEKLPGRQELSKLGGHWYTEVGLLNQMVAIWPYDDLDQRARIRREAESGPNPKWPPDTSELIISMVSEIYLPAPFMAPLGERKLGPLYEMRLYTYPPESIPQVLEAWSKGIAERVKLSPLAGCWYSEFGGLNNFIHLWAYPSFDERLRIREEARAKGIWPPRNSVTPVRQETKILFPAPFSPMQ
ncbi:NIPSNAP family protein [Candidatus Poribacteria bacterium]|nr:NIPSNAP family protein [Candidatus Poribacteria bacterium]